MRIPNNPLHFGAPTSAGAVLAQPLLALRGPDDSEGAHAQGLTGSITRLMGTVRDHYSGYGGRTITGATRGLLRTILVRLASLPIWNIGLYRGSVAFSRAH